VLLTWRRLFPILACLQGQERRAAEPPAAPPPTGDAEGARAAPQHAARDATDERSLQYERDRDTEAARVRVAGGRLGVSARYVG
jgi:hypothetical protein